MGTLGIREGWVDVEGAGAGKGTGKGRLNENGGGGIVATEESSPAGARGNDV